MIDKEYLGSDFDDFLRNEGFIEDAEAIAAKRVIAFQIAEEMKRANITKTELAHRMHTSRPVVDRLLDPSKWSFPFQRRGKRSEQAINNWSTAMHAVSKFRYGDV